MHSWQEIARSVLVGHVLAEYSGPKEQIKNASQPHVDPLKCKLQIRLAYDFLALEKAKHGGLIPWRLCLLDRKIMIAIVYDLVKWFILGLASFTNMVDRNERPH